MSCKGSVTILALLMTIISMATVDSASRAEAHQPPDCTPQLTEMEPCLLFVEGKTTIPGSACCSSLSSVFHNSPVCLCEIVSSSGGVASTSGINVTNAMLLPSICKVPTDPSRCPALLSGSPATAPINSPRPSDEGRHSSNAAPLNPSVVTFLACFFASELLVTLHL